VAVAMGALLKFLFSFPLDCIGSAKGSCPFTLPWRDTRRAEGDVLFPWLVAGLYAHGPWGIGERPHCRCITLSTMGTWSTSAETSPATAGSGIRRLRRENSTASIQLFFSSIFLLCLIYVFISH
jgi:hypothetical protein